MIANWPLVGRDDVLARCGTLLGKPSLHGLALSGEAGVGKTRLLEECAQRAEGSGFAVLRATGHRASATIPFGALAPLLPSDARMIEAGVPMLGQAGDALTTAAEGRPLVLAIDDAHLLDEPSTLLLYQLVANRRLFAMVTVCSDEPSPDALTALWRDDRAERIDVDRLDRAEVSTLLTEALGGPVLAAVVDEFFTASAGNAMVLRELVRGSIDAGTLVEQRGLWRIQGALAPSARLRELVVAQIGRLSAAARQTLELIAIGGPLGLTEAERLGAVEIEELERQALLLASPSGLRTNLSLAHASVGEVLRAELPLLRGRALRRDLAEGLGRVGARRRGDILRMATLQLDADGTGPPDLLAAAARQAYFANDLGLAERLARAAEVAEPRFETQHLLKDVLYRLGRGEEGRSIEVAEATEAQRALRAMSDAATAFWQLGDRPGADRILDDAAAVMTAATWREEMIAMRATLDANAGEPDLALARITQVTATSGRPFVVASLAATLALPHVGRARESLDRIDPARTAHLALDDPATMFQADLLTSTEGSSMMELGRLVEATEVAAGGFWRSEQGHDTAGQAFNAFVLGRVYQARGMMVSAMRWSREAVVLFEAIGHRGPLRWALGSLALAAVLHGDVAPARIALQRLDDMPGHPAASLDSDIDRARAWLAVAEGDPVTARALLARAGEACASRGLLALEMVLLHDRARLDAAKSVVDRMIHLCHGVQGQWLPALADDAAALAGKRADELAASAETLAGLGAMLIAAETATRAGAAHAAGGNQREATVWRRKAASWIGQCEGARTPAIAQADGPVPLTDREREIALLAANGLSSKSISERLFLSARTVDNNLARVFSKLGISDRSAIAGALALD